MSIKPRIPDAPVTGEAVALVAAPAAKAADAAASTFKAADAAASTLTDTVPSAAPAFGVSKPTMKESMEKAMKTAEELVAFGQGNVEAIMRSGQIWAAGFQDLSKQVAATAQASFDETVSTFKAITSARSLKDAFDLQASFARATFEKTLSESGRLTDASFRLTEQAIAPLTARVTLAVEKFAKPA